jgi:hypothetical protein
MTTQIICSSSTYPDSVCLSVCSCSLLIASVLVATFLYIYINKSFLFGLLKRKDKQIRPRLSLKKRGFWYLTCMNTLHKKQTTLFIRELMVWLSVSREKSSYVQVYSFAKPQFVTVLLCPFPRFHWRFLTELSSCHDAYDVVPLAPNFGTE